MGVNPSQAKTQNGYRSLSSGTMGQGHLGTIAKLERDKYL